MTLARLAAPTARVVTRRAASSYSEDLSNNKWRTINRLASEGKWDNINNCPKWFLFGESKKETYAAYNAINQKSDYWSQTPYGQVLKAIWRITLFVCAVKAGVTVYEFVVPEEKRLQYKYRDAHGHH